MLHEVKWLALVQVIMVTWPILWKDYSLPLTRCPPAYIQRGCGQMLDWHASFLDFFFLTATVGAKNSNILILKCNGKMQWLILNSQIAKFCF